MRTALYLRVSLDKSGDGLGIERQREDCRKLAEQRGWTVVYEIEENNTSASFGPRPGFEQLLHLMERRQVAAVIVWHVDRLLRKMTDLERVIELVERTGIRMVTVSGDISLDTDMGRMVGRIMASVARAEVERKSARHKRANLQKAQAGKPHGSKRAYGYEADLITLNEPEAAILREMARRVMAGRSYKEVAFWANAHGYRTTTGKIFYPLTVRNLLHKKRYAGVREHKGAEYPAVWEPVFDAETWERLQLTLRLRHEKAGYNQGAPKARKYLLTGLVFCGRCGWPMSGSRMYDVQRTTGNPGDSRRVYFCTKRTDTLELSGCNGLRRNAEALEDFVVQCVLYRLDSPALVQMLQAAENNQELCDLINTRQTHADRLEALIDDYATGLLDRSQFARAKQTAEVELQRMNAQIQALTRSQTATALLPASMTVRKAWDEAESMEWRRQLLELVIEQVVVHPAVKKPWYVAADGTRFRFDPSQVDINWRV